MELGQGTGPLRGVKVVELAGIGPGPHACMILADLGADVIRIDRPGGQPLSMGGTDIVNRGRPNVALDLKNPEAVATVLDLVADADILIEGMRPEVTERMGLGPDDCFARNPRLVYGRMTGWGQTGPLSHSAGHDMNYISIAGALFGLGQQPDRPHFPGNLVGDYGGGSTYLVIGVLAALLEARVSGKGQVVDAAIVDGTAHLNAVAVTLQQTGMGQPDKRAAGLLDGGTPFYDIYATSDGRHVSVGPLESQFFADFIERLGVADRIPGQMDFDRFDEMRDLIAETFASKTMAEWTEVFEGTDSCVAPVLTLPEATQHPHNVERGVFVDLDGVTQPAPAPRFSRTESSLGLPPARPGAHTEAALTAWGIPAERVRELVEAGIAVQRD